MLKAKLDSVRKNKKGFSLVELIIVIAIMVALIAVMAPAFVKYVQKSRDSALASAAEDYETAVQTYVADPDTAADKIWASAASPASFTITIYVDTTTSKCTTAFSGGATGLKTTLDGLAGLDANKKMGSTTKAFQITVDPNNNNTKVTMVSGTWSGSAFTADSAAADPENP